MNRILQRNLVCKQSRLNNFFHHHNHHQKVKRSFNNSKSNHIHRFNSTSSNNKKMQESIQKRFLVSLDPEHPQAKAPTKGSALAAGYDLYASQNVIIPKGGRVVVPTGIRVAIPEGSYGRVAPRSGLGN